MRRRAELEKSVSGVLLVCARGRSLFSFRGERGDAAVGCFDVFPMGEHHMQAVRSSRSPRTAAGSQGMTLGQSASSGLEFWNRLGRDSRRFGDF